MVQQISALIVQPAVDASKYTAGAQEKIAADKAMAASSREAGADATDTSAKINQSGDVLARLSRQYVEGYAGQQRFNQGLNQLDRGLQSGKINMEGAERILVGMNQRLGITANAAELAAKGQMTLAAAVDRANAQIARQATELATADAANRRFQASNSNVVSAGQRQAAGFNAGQQLQDIAMMSVIGQSPAMLAMQQGPQLATAIQQGGGLAALGAGLGSLLSVTTLLTIGFTAATAATIQWFMKGKDGAKELEEKLKGHSETLSRLKQQYGELGDASKNMGGPVGGSAYTEAQARSEVDTIRAAIRSQSGDLSKELIGGGFLRGGLFGSKSGALDTLLSTKNSPFQAAVDTLMKSIRDGNGGLEKFDANLNEIFDDLRGKSSEPAKLAEEMQRLSDAALDAFAVSGKMSPFQGEIDRLLLGLKEGNGDLSTFATNMRRIGELNGLGKQADDAILAAKEVVNLAEKLKEVEQILRRIDQENTRPGLRDQRELRRYVAGRDADARILEQQFAADQQLTRARTNAERMAAIEAQVRARAKEDGDKGGGLQSRVDRALAEERTRQEVEARDAAIQRSQSMERSLQQQKLQLDLIGKTGGEQAKLTYEFERMQELREQAARTGEPIDQKEVANIQAAAEAMGMYADALARAKMGDDLSFESDQLRRTSQDQQIAARLRGAGLPVDLNGQFAQQMRDNQYYSDAKDSASGFVRTFGDELINSGGDIGKSLGKAIQNALLDATSKAWERLADQLGIAFANWLTGSSGEGAGSGAFGTASGFADMLFGKGGANDNYPAPAGTVTRAPLPDIGMSAYRDAIGSIESAGSGGYSALGPIHKTLGQALGRYQIMEANLPAWSQAALGRSVGRSEFMGSPALQDAIFDNRFGSYVDKYGASGAASMWFTGRPSAPNATDVLGTTGSAYVDKFNKALGNAGENLNAFGGGLGKLGNALNQFPAAPSGGGGGVLSSIFGGFSGFGSMMRGFSISPKASMNILAGHWGAFADGTENAPPGWAWVGEQGPELRKLRAGDVIRSNPRSMDMVANQNHGHAQQPKIDLHVSVYGGSGDDHVRMLAKQGAQEAIGQYNEAQTRGGFGEMQRRFASQKG